MPEKRLATDFRGWRNSAAAAVAWVATPRTRRERGATDDAMATLYVPDKAKKRRLAEEAALNAPSGVGEGERVNIIAQLEDAEGNPTGPELDLPHDADPKQLEELLNALLQNEDKVPFAFYAAENEVIGQLGEHLRKHKASVEQVLRIVYQPQALFRVRPVTRCSSAIPGHAEAVLSVAFSPDGKHLASGSGDTTVRLWNHETETPKHTCKGHSNWVLCIAWSPDGRVIASGGMDKDVRLWDPVTGAAVGGAMKGHKKHVTALAWEPAHVRYPPVRLASASGDGTVRIWNTVHRNCEVALTAHTNSVTSVKWGGEGLIYTASRDTTIFVWDAKDGKVVRQLKGHGHWVNTLALSSEYAVRTGPYDHKAIKPENDEEAKAKALERYKAATAGKPERLISGSDDFTMFMWTPGTSKQPLNRMTGHVQLINHVLFSPDGRWAASASFDKAVKLWDGHTGAFVATMRGHVGPVYQIAWSADSRMVVSGSKDSTLKVWSARTKKLELDLPGHEDEVFAVDWSPMGTKAASGGKDKMLRLWRH